VVEGAREVKGARDLAREAIKAIREGKPREGHDTFETVAEDWFQRHVRFNKLISAPDLRSVLDRHLLPAWRDRDFITIRRGDVSTMQDAVQDSSGAVAADFVLGVIRTICNWYETKHDNYTSPLCGVCGALSRRIGLANAP